MRILEPPPQSEVDSAIAAVSAFGSVEVREAWEELRKLNNKFFRAVQYYQEDKARGAPPGSTEQVANYRQVEDVRKQYHEKYAALSERVATELQDLPR